MKKIMFVFVALVSLSTGVLASVLHVEPTDSVELIPAGSYIEFVKDFNVKPRQLAHLLGIDGDNKCFMYVSEAKNEDRVIKKGTKIEISFHGMNYPRFSSPNNTKIESIYCQVPASKNLNMTVKEFTDAISSTAVLKMSEPVEF